MALIPPNNNNNNHESTPLVVAATSSSAVVNNNDNTTFLNSGSGGLDPIIFQEATNSNNNNATNHSGNEDGTPVFRDVAFSVLFWIHMAVMIYLGVVIAPKGYATTWNNVISFDNDTGGDDTTTTTFDWKHDFEQINWSDFTDDGFNMTKEDLKHVEEFISQAIQYSQVYPFRILVFMILPCCILSFVVAFTTTAYIIRPYAQFMVTASLVISCALVVMFCGLILWTLPSLLTVIILIFVMLLQSLAVKGLWKTIPFASVNLSVSLEGISANCGIYFVAFCFAELGFVFVMYWFYTLVGVLTFQDHSCREIWEQEQQQQDNNNNQRFLQQDDDDDDDNDLDYDCYVLGPTVIFLLLSLHWTTTIIANTIHVTTAGVMATWCFDKSDADRCCSPAVGGSVFRSMTYAFGSICFGSLLQALVSILRYFVEETKRAQAEEGGGGGTSSCCGSLLNCLCSCICQCLEELLEYFNQWAYVFIGIYGHSYLDSGRMVFDLFQARGWTSIVTDRLVHYALRYTTFIVAIVMGFLAVALDHVVSYNKNSPTATSNAGEAAQDEGTSSIPSYVYGPVPQPRYFAFATGFIIAIPICSVMMNVVDGAVNTLIVCWADSPARLEANHPQATNIMAHAWNEVFPDAGVHLLPHIQQQQQQQQQQTLPSANPIF